MAYRGRRGSRRRRFQGRKGAHRSRRLKSYRSARGGIRL